MASEIKNLSQKQDFLPDGSNFKIGIVVSEYYSEITDKLLDGCLEVFSEQNVQQENLFIYYAPGTFELPIACQRLNRWHKLDAVIALGCVVKGDTDHDKYINQSVANSLQDMAIKYGKPFMFGVLTPNTYEQAQERAGGKLGNKGHEVANATLKILDLEQQLKNDSSL